MYKSGNAGKLPAKPKYIEIVKNFVFIVVLCLYGPWMHGHLPGFLDTYKHTNIWGCELWLLCPYVRISVYLNTNIHYCCCASYLNCHSSLEILVNHLESRRPKIKKSRTSDIFVCVAGSSYAGNLPGNRIQTQCIDSVFEGFCWFSCICIYKYIYTNTDIQIRTYKYTYKYKYVTNKNIVTYKRTNTNMNTYKHTKIHI